MIIVSTITTWINTCLNDILPLSKIPVSLCMFFNHCLKRAESIAFLGHRQTYFNLKWPNIFMIKLKVGPTHKEKMKRNKMMKWSEGRGRDLKSDSERPCAAMTGTGSPPDKWMVWIGGPACEWWTADILGCVFLWGLGWSVGDERGNLTEEEAKKRSVRNGTRERLVIACAREGEGTRFYVVRQICSWMDPDPLVTLGEFSHHWAIFHLKWIS